MLEIDSHAHIFEVGLELAPVRRYAPTYNATVDDYVSVLESNGVQHGVLVQPSVLGTNNDYMMQALRKHRDKLRGTQNESKIEFAATRKNLEKWIPDPKDRMVILRDTPRRLFHFNYPAET
jgi:predicted TIM-barrel fold metal-dependent hydrolase